MYKIQILIDDVLVLSMQQSLPGNEEPEVVKELLDTAIELLQHKRRVLYEEPYLGRHVFAQFNYPSDKEPIDLREPPEPIYE